MIGDSTTGGMSSSKAKIPLPSGLFELSVSAYSNKKRFNRGRGLEGVGVIPYETVELEAADLAEGSDMLIRRAERVFEASSEQGSRRSCRFWLEFLRPLPIVCL